MNGEVFRMKAKRSLIVKFLVAALALTALAGCKTIGSGIQGTGNLIGKAGGAVKNI